MRILRWRFHARSSGVLPSSGTGCGFGRRARSAGDPVMMGVAIAPDWSSRSMTARRSPRYVSEKACSPKRRRRASSIGTASNVAVTSRASSGAPRTSAPVTRPTSVRTSATGSFATRTVRWPFRYSMTRSAPDTGERAPSTRAASPVNPITTPRRAWRLLLWIITAPPFHGSGAWPCAGSPLRVGARVRVGLVGSFEPHSGYAEVLLYRRRPDGRLPLAHATVRLDDHTRQRQTNRGGGVALHIAQHRGAQEGTEASAALRSAFQGDGRVRELG